MKKWIAFLLALVVTIGMLTGCSKKTTKKSSGSGSKGGSSQTDGTGASNGAVNGDHTNDQTIAAVISNGQELSSATVNYYFVDYLKNLYRQLQAYYGENTALYFSYMGINIDTPLNAQFTSSGATQTWADYFLDAAMDLAMTDLALCDRAKAEGFQLSEADRLTLAENAQMLDYYAMIGGYASKEDYLKALYGSSATLASYNTYAENATLASAYYEAYTKSVNITEEQIRQRDDGSYDKYANDRYLASVRHLLVEFEGGTTNPLGGVTYSDEDKATAKAEAERLLQLWKDGAATEEYFVTLVREYTDDRASAETGGLYENIHPESPYVEAFLNWAVDPDRLVGDIDIVETEYGYHIMFFTGHSQITVRDYMISEALRKETIDTWYAGLTENTTFTLTNTANLKLDMTISALG